jgi:predicted dithiol-disulfide oxidoreductase (DUF899 family)
MTKTTEDLAAEIAAVQASVTAQRERLTSLRRAWAKTSAEAVHDYELLDSDGTGVRLSELFGDHADLIVVHNMGRSCPYCTLWADGFIGLHKHLVRRAAFVVSSPDTPEAQREFAASRGWPFRMVSVRDSSFPSDMGFKQDGDYWPGYSTFQRQADGSNRRVGKDLFGPGDDYCALWHMFDLLADGANEWQPEM